MTGCIKSNDLKKFEHLQVPRIVWEMFVKKNISQTAFKIYIEFFDRIKLSRYNKWIDREGNVYIKYSYNELMEILSVKSKGTISDALKELKKLGLLIQEKGFNTSSKFYLSNILKSTVEQLIEDNNIIDQTQSSEKSNTVVQSTEHSSLKNRTQSSEKLDANHNNYNHNNYNHNNYKKSIAKAIVPEKQFIKRYREFIIKVLPGVNIPVLDSQLIRLKNQIDEDLMAELEKSSYLKGENKNKPGIHLFTVIKNINDIKLGAYRDKAKDLPVKSNFKDNITDEKMKEWGLI